MSPDDDWALGQNEVDVRNEARNPLNALPIRESGLDAALAWSSPSVFVCHDPEQAWIDESRAEAEREDSSTRKGQAD